MNEAHKRNALMSRLATDLYAVASGEQQQRPCDMPCCVLIYEKPVGPGITESRGHFLCEPDCKHAHHRAEWFAVAYE